MALSTSVDSTYADDGSDASVKIHQQDHDTIHTAVNALAGGATGQVLAKTSSADYAQAWQTPGFGGGDYFKSGFYSNGLSVTGPMASTGSMAVGQILFRPFLIPVRRAFDRIGINVVTAATAASGGLLRMGIYADSGGQPGTFILDAGTISSESTGARELTISQTLDPGVVWLAVVAQVATCTATAYVGDVVLPFLNTDTAPPSAAGRRWRSTASTFTSTLPSPAPALTAGAASMAATALRAA